MAARSLKLWFWIYFIFISFKYTRGKLDQELSTTTELLDTSSAKTTADGISWNATIADEISQETTTAGEITRETTTASETSREAKTAGEISLEATTVGEISQETTTAGEIGWDVPNAECVRYTDSLPWKPAVEQCLSWGGKVPSYTARFDLPQIPADHTWTGDYRRTTTASKDTFQDPNVAVLCAFVKLFNLKDVSAWFFHRKKIKFDMSPPIFEDCFRWNKVLCVRKGEEYLTVIGGEHAWANATRQCVLWDGSNRASHYLNDKYNTLRHYWINGIREQSAVRGSSNISDITECGVYANSNFSFTTKCSNVDQRLMCVLPSVQCDLSTTTDQLSMQPPRTTAIELNWDTATASDVSHPTSSSNGAGLLVGVVAGIVVLRGGAVVAMVLVIRYRRRKDKLSGGTETSGNTEEMRTVSASYEDVV